jgi:CRP/FNR family cyclic AMP-dependent transcriptional regulator
MGNPIDLLRLVPLFQELNTAEMELIWNITIQRSYTKRGCIFFEGMDKEAIFFIEDGLVKTFKIDENGHEQMISFLRTGAMFPFPILR